MMSNTIHKHNLLVLITFKLLESIVNVQKIRNRVRITSMHRVPKDNNRDGSSSTSNKIQQKNPAKMLELLCAQVCMIKFQV